MSTPRGDDELIRVVDTRPASARSVRRRRLRHGTGGGGVGRAERHDGEGQQWPCRRRSPGPSRKKTLSTWSGMMSSLRKNFSAVGDRLQQAERPDAVGPDAVLHPGGDLALEQDQVGARSPAARP